MSNWYYSEFGQTKGPVSVGFLVDKVLKQELELDSHVMKDGKAVWIRIRNVEEIMREVDKPADLPHLTFHKDFHVDGALAPKENLYFYIPIKRLVILNILSIGFYQLYWFYRQWHHWAVKHKQSHQSFDREAGRIFFYLSVLNKIETDKELNAIHRADFNGNRLFMLWAFVALGCFILLSLKGVPKLLHEFFYLVLLITDVVFLLPVQRYINKVNEHLGNTYAKFGFWEYAAVLLGFFPLVAMLIFLPFRCAAKP